MKHDLEETLREAHLAFLGRLLSAVTHELKNHLAIISESSGLMGDLLEMGKLKEEDTSAKFLKIIRCIAERIDTANTQVKYLNSFGHRMDTPAAVFNVNSVLLEEAALLKKFAGLTGADIVMDLQNDIPSVKSKPALLQFLVFILVNAFLRDAKKGDHFRFVSRKENKHVVIIFEEQRAVGKDEGKETAARDVELIPYIVEKLEADLEKELRNTGFTYRLIMAAT
ncbi:MAG: hypothetical protein SCH71_02780 [Desulfobulbaceae bacterium]|nr:hypothetical protein [Desulfobulbaceae bacterium]